MIMATIIIHIAITSIASLFTITIHFFPFEILFEPEPKHTLTHTCTSTSEYGHHGALTCCFPLPIVYCCCWCTVSWDIGHIPTAISYHIIIISSLISISSLRFFTFLRSLSLFLFLAFTCIHIHILFVPSFIYDYVRALGNIPWNT